MLDATYEVGLSGPGRLHDLFVTHEAMSPGEWKAGGEGLTIHYGFHPSPFGNALVMATERGLAGLAFADPGEEKPALADMQRPLAEGDATSRTCAAHRAARAPHLRREAAGATDQPLRVVLIGTDFEVRVWETLLRIPMGRRRHLFRHRRQDRQAEGRPRGRRRGRQKSRSASWCRATACIGKAGEFTGYHWGLTRKRAMLGWEAGAIAA